MTPGMQVLLLIVGALVSALLTGLLTQVYGLRADMRGFMEGQKNINDRLLKLETEHNMQTELGVRVCATGGAHAR